MGVGHICSFKSFQLSVVHYYNPCMYVTLLIYHISSVLNGLRYDVCYTINISYILSVEWVEIRCMLHY